MYTIRRTHIQGLNTHSVYSFPVHRCHSVVSRRLAFSFTLHLYTVTQLSFSTGWKQKEDPLFSLFSPASCFLLHFFLLSSLQLKTHAHGHNDTHADTHMQTHTNWRLSFSDQSLSGSRAVKGLRGLSAVHGVYCFCPQAADQMAKAGR